MDKNFKYVMLGILAIIGAFLYFYFKGKKEGEGDATTEQVPLPSKYVNQEGKTETFTKEEAQTIRDYAIKLYNDISGLNWTHESELYREFMALSDFLFVAIYNDFNNYYKKELGKETLRNWIMDDEYSYNTQVFDTLIQRFNNLNLV
ncbi:MAG: hypothetical protein WC389_18275 [Lutibacter sp.]|jgi:hypothetical protein